MPAYTEATRTGVSIEESFICCKVCDVNNCPTVNLKVVSCRLFKGLEFNTMQTGKNANEIQVFELIC